EEGLDVLIGQLLEEALDRRLVPLEGEAVGLRGLRRAPRPPPRLQQERRALSRPRLVSPAVRPPGGRGGRARPGPPRRPPLPPPPSPASPPPCPAATRTRRP